MRASVRHALTALMVTTFALLVFSSMGLIATGCTGHKRQDTLRASLIAVDAARDGFVKLDGDRQQAIVAAATSFEDGKTKLEAYRAWRDKILVAFPVVYRAIALASMHDDEASLNDAIKQAKVLLKAIEAFKEGL
jgi:hypothetical protein